MDKIKIYKEIISMMGLEKEKDGFYHTGWGKKTEEGMMASIDNILSPIVEQLEKYEYIRKNTQFKDLKAQLEQMTKSRDHYWQMYDRKRRR